MSFDPSDDVEPVERTANMARAIRADADAFARSQAAIDDLFLPDDARLDEETRALVGERLMQLVEALEGEIADLAERSVGLSLRRGVFARLLASGLLRDPALAEEMVALVHQDLLADGLRATVAPDDRSNLLGRLIDCPDGRVAAAARAVFSAENRAFEGSAEVEPAVRRKLGWWIAAALRGDVADVELDHALAEAVDRTTSARADGERLDATALRLVAAIEPRPEEFGGLLIDALADARPLLFVAAIANAASLTWADARALALDPQGERLWMILRAHDLERSRIARIGLMLAEADHRRAVEAFADRLDALAAIEQDRAVAAIAPLRFDPEFRAALRVLDRARL